SGFVHVKGTVVAEATLPHGCVNAPEKAIFVLPAGYRPARRESTASLTGVVDSNTTQLAVIIVDGPSVAAVPACSGPGDPGVDPNHSYLSPDSISFRCAPSGKNGCP